jgi:hypothetical protein
MMREQAVDLNDLLTGANLLVAALMVLVFDQTADNPYLDWTTLLLGLLLCAQTQVALWHERRHRDPFVILLASEMIVYYALRLCTITLYPFSFVFDRYAYTPADSNRALVFILIANLWLYAGFYFVKFRSDQAVTSADRKAVSPGRTVLLLLVAIGVGYSSIHYGVEDAPSSLASLLSLFIEPRTVIMMALAYYLLFRASLGKAFTLTIAALIIVEMALHTLAGSRGALVGFVESCTIVILAIAGCMRFPRKYLVLGVILSPVIVVALVGSFAISTFNRAQREGAPFDVNQALTTATESGMDLDVVPGLDLVLAPLFARVGFFDFSAEIIAHRKEYGSVLNLTAYAKSIVDNVLTPGFDVYDQPRTAHALQFLYREWGTPSKEAAVEFYQSDQLGIYGELYGLFEYASLPLFFLIAYLLKRTFVRLKGANPFTFAMKRVIVLFVFVDLLHSYGVDWVMVETVPLVAAILIFGPFFATRPISVVQTRSPGAAASRAIANG